MIAKKAFLFNYFHRRIKRGQAYSFYCKKYKLNPENKEENLVILYNKFLNGLIFNVKEAKLTYNRYKKEKLRNLDLIRQWLQTFLIDKKDCYKEEEIDKSLKHYFDITPTSDNTIIWYNNLGDFWASIIEEVAPEFGYNFYLRKTTKKQKYYAYYVLTSYQKGKKPRKKLKIFYNPTETDIKKWLESILKNKNELIITRGKRDKSLKAFLYKEFNIKDTISFYNMNPKVKRISKSLGWNYKELITKLENRKSIRVWKFTKIS